MVRRYLLYIQIVVLVFALALCAGAATVSDVVNLVDRSSYTNYLNNDLYTHNGDTRVIGSTQHNLAMANISSVFGGFGLSTTYNTGTFGGVGYSNVVGVLQGTTNPNDIYLVGGHYDSVAAGPGADDNASGTAGVLEAARVLSQFSFQATIVFVAFDSEEAGLIGSQGYMQSHSTDNILGMISMDMIAYNPTGVRHNYASIMGRPASNSVKQGLADAMALYGNGLIANQYGPLDGSDQAPFEWAGKPACLLIEDAISAGGGNPYYHSASDSVDTANYIDYIYATNMTRSTVGYLANSAGLIAVPEPGSLAAIGGGLVWLVVVIRRRRIE